MTAGEIPPIRTAISRLKKQHQPLNGLILHIIEDEAVDLKTDNNLKGLCLCRKVDVPLDSALVGTALYL